VKTKRHILVVELLGGFGEVLLVLPAVHALALSHPDADVSVPTSAPGHIGAGQAAPVVLPEDVNLIVRRATYGQPPHIALRVESVFSTDDMQVVRPRVSTHPTTTAEKLT
jgi:hypothetical protein